MIIFENKIKERNQCDQAIDSIIQRIKSNGIPIVGLLSDRNAELLYLIQALFDNGIAFVTIDPLFPQERIQYIIRDSGIKTIITQEKYKDQLPDVETITFDDTQDYPPKHYDDYIGNDTAYILYTSGSTGMPKGVEVTRDALLNFIEGVSEIIDFSAGKQIACLTTVSFDIFFLESLMALHKGLTVVLANEDEQRNPKLMAKLIQENKIDMIQLTPSRMQLLSNHDKSLSCLKNVKEIMIGGESFPLSLLKTLQENTTAKIYNMYGPTETTIWSTVSDLTNKDRVDIGQPIKNTEIYIVDESLYILPNGQAGEICIAGKGLAKGYVGRNDLTAENFIYLPQNPEIKVYRSGDLGRYRDGGNLEYLGRTDNQVKVRGYRIELEEIESYLNQFKGVNQSVVIALETSDTDKILQAFYTSANNINAKEISDYLSTKIPPYMIPSIFKRIEEFIQTANGKIDRKRVLECIEIKSDKEISQTSASDELNVVQRRAFEIIIESLSKKSIENISIEMDFNSIGLDSITFIKTIVALEGEFDFEFDDEMLLITKFPTIRTMIDYVESKAK
jgi:amino acid adenylation domain-containing protein